MLLFFFQRRLKIPNYFVYWRRRVRFLEDFLTSESYPARRMTASSSLSGEEWNERNPLTSYFWMSEVCRPALFEWAESVDQLFHMSWATKYLVISYPTGIWELQYRPQKYVGYDKTRFSITPAHMKRAGHPLPLSSKEWVTRSCLAQESWLPTPARLKRANNFNQLRYFGVSCHTPISSWKKRKLTVENKLIKNWTKTLKIWF